MNDDPYLSRLLVPVILGEDRNAADVPFQLLSDVQVILLGLYPVSDQVSPEQLKQQVSEKAREELLLYEEEFQKTGADLNVLIRYTADVADTIQTIIEEENCDAIISPGRMKDDAPVLVGVKGSPEEPVMTFFLEDLLKKKPNQVSLIHIMEKGENREEKEQMLSEMKEHLVELGFDEDRITSKCIESEQDEEKLVELAGEFGVTIIAEKQKNLKDLIFDSVREKIEKTSTSPMIIVLQDE